jgi:hypothetical protein
VAEVTAVLRVGVAFVLAWAAIAKLRHFDSFVALVPAYFGDAVRPSLIAVAILSAEMVCSLLLTLGLSAGAALAMLLFLGFTFGTAVAITRGATGSCACFGDTDREPLNWFVPLRAGVLSVVGLAVLIAGPGNVQPQDVPLAIVTAAGFALVVRLLPELGHTWDIFRAPVPNPPATRRRSFRHIPPTESLFESGGTIVPLEVLTPTATREQAP